MKDTLGPLETRGRFSGSVYLKVIGYSSPHSGKAASNGPITDTDG